MSVEHRRRVYLWSQKSRRWWHRWRRGRRHQMKHWDRLPRTAPLWSSP